MDWPCQEIPWLKFRLKLLKLYNSIKQYQMYLTSGLKVCVTGMVCQTPNN